MKLIYPAPDDLVLVDFDLVTDDVTGSHYRSTWILYGVDHHGVKWQWYEHRDYSHADNEWTVSEPFDMERVS